MRFAVSEKTMDNNLLTGKLVRLTALDPEHDAESVERWEHDTEYMRLLNVRPTQLIGAKKWKEQMEEPLNERRIEFAIRTLAENRLIGFLNLMGLQNQHGDCFVGIGIGEREFWGKGYGTDAMRVGLRFAFQELNRHRVSLMVVSTNPRAIRSYEKSGFAVEGRTRGTNHRMGERVDIVHMGILRSEWEAIQAGVKKE